MDDPRAAAITEADLQLWVLELAQWLGYLRMHQRPMETKSGRWLTPIQGDAGFPDVVLAHKSSGKVLFRELKSQDGKVTKEQLMWLAATGGTIWRPSHWLVGDIERELKEGTKS